MLCSAPELGISDEQGGLLELAADTPLGQDLRQALRLDDTVFTLKLTPNLAHALSVFGVAREVAALTGAALRAPAIAAVAPTHDQRLPVEVRAADLCGRFSGRIVRGVDPGARTPAWMVERLARCGQRSVSALVDISNYVMFELGRPSHVFDLDKIHDRLVVRWAEPGETLKLLNGSTVELDASVGVIADDKAVESLAGIMGGDATAVSDDTRNIYVEAAFWWPQAVAGRSRRFGFSTDAGHRFERGVDPAQTAAHVERITQLIMDICGGAAGPLDDQVLALPQPAPVAMRVARASRVVGMPLTLEQCAGVFQRLGLTFSQDAGTLHVQPPSWRFDLAIEEDLIEEVIRVIGYDKLPSSAPLAPVAARVGRESERSPTAVRRALAALDYQETINFSFVEERWERELAGNADAIRVLNPIAAPLSVMRSSLLGGLVHVLRGNLARKSTRVRVFELGRVFTRDGSVVDGPLTVAGVNQPMRVAGLAFGAADAVQWGCSARAVDFFDIKGDVESLLGGRSVRFLATTHPALHPGRCAAVEVDGRLAGHVGELHPQWRMAYELPHAPVVFELDLAPVQQGAVPAYQPVSRQQPVWRDVALVLGDEVPHDALIASLMADPTGLVRKATLFDVFKPATVTAGMRAGEKSLTVRIELLDFETTLTDERIEASVALALTRVGQAFGARLRG
jgi:phenylalanyl-tRNA synthetase beta chain